MNMMSPVKPTALTFTISSEAERPSPPGKSIVESVFTGADAITVEGRAMSTGGGG
eukprot:CAMPEP_0172513774 /NCGR_PEP_ID=MMETSP1066-20121228/255267_1 /TAXON_ID=671091 /ORGANISM="Coscinodiscus wailesii, Strain CCMP2513" /LENGTH=54 /DNA_ID=CAMNT_0013294181 /DNA_START=527 /DNA_END=687 /DNA_ORIENTATION=-